jgi:hypothetical protein
MTTCGWYTVIAGNIGTVCETYSHKIAEQTYQLYVDYSNRGYGRVSGEDVILFRDRDVVKEYTGKINAEGH